MSRNGNGKDVYRRGSCTKKPSDKRLGRAKIRNRRGSKTVGQTSPKEQ